MRRCSCISYYISLCKTCVEKYTFNFKYMQLDTFLFKDALHLSIVLTMETLNSRSRPYYYSGCSPAYFNSFIYVIVYRHTPATMYQGEYVKQ